MRNTLTNIYRLIVLILVICTIKSNAQTNFNLSNLLSFDGEPYVAINPANPTNIIAGWMRLRVDGKIWIATKASFDQGQTWSAINFLPHDTIVNGSADVSIAFHNSGVAYLSYINFRTSPDTVGAVFLSKSTDGGLTWGIPYKVISGTDKPDLPFDRPWVAVDNSGGINDGTVFVTAMSAYWYIGQHHIYLRTSNDSGVTWSSIKQIDTTGFSPGVFTMSNGVISIGKDGKVYIAYVSYDTSVSPFIRYYCATTINNGFSFQRNVVGNAFGGGGSNLTKGWCLKANPAMNGSAALTWIDNRYGDSDVLLSKTTDGGLTWSPPVRINDDTINNGIEQDMVWADFSSSGKFSAAWRDRRLNGIGSTVPFDIYLTVSTDNLNTFNQNYRVTTVSSPYFLVPQGNSFIGLSMNDSIIVLDWGDYRNTPDWDIYFNKTDISVITSVNEIANIEMLKIFPNPSSNRIYFEMVLPINGSSNEIVLYNSLGEIVKIFTPYINNQNHISDEIDVSNLSCGVYYLYAKVNSAFYSSAKFIKN